VNDQQGGDLVGLEATQRFVVDDSMSAEAFGNPGFAVLGTPALVGLVETVAMAAVAPYLPPGAGTVGGRVELIHKAPTPLGMVIEVRARVTKMEGRAIHFAITATDALEQIAEGTHLRFQVDRDKFLGRVATKGAIEA
jgi:fluoroacetyl-CoA thioesterase